MIEALKGRNRVSPFQGSLMIWMHPKALPWADDYCPFGAWETGKS